MTDDNITFMFYTRTLSEDYRVFSGDVSADGNNEPDDYAKFKQFMRMAQVESDGEASAIVYEAVDRWYLAVFGLNRKSRDKAGREKRFSFCVSFNGSSIKEVGRAMRSFSRVVNDWGRIGELADSLLEEIPAMREYDVVVDKHDEKTGSTKRVRKHKTVPGEDVRFDCGGFIDELVRYKPTVPPPESGHMLKYFADTNEIVSIGMEDEEESGEGYTYRWVIGLLLAGVIGVGLLMWYFMPGKSPSKPPEQPSNSQGVPSRQPENSSETSQDVTNNNKEAANVKDNQAGGKVIMPANNESHNNDFSLGIHGDNGGAVSPGSGDNAASQRDKGNTQPAVQTQTGNR